MLVRLALVCVLFIVVILTIIFFFLSLKDKSSKKIFHIFLAISIISTYLMFFAGQYMFPRVEKSNITEAVKNIVSRSDENNWRTEVETDYCEATIIVNKKIIEKTEDVFFDEFYKNEYSILEKAFSKSGKADEIRYVFGFLNGYRDPQYFFYPTCVDGELMLSNDNYIIYISYSYKNTDFEQMVKVVTLPEIFYKEKIDLNDIANAQGKIETDYCDLM